MVAAAVFFSSWTSPMLAALFTVAFYLGGHLNDAPMIDAAQRSSPALIPLLSVMRTVLPNLEHFNIRSAAVYGLVLPEGYVLWALLYSAVYSGLLCCLGCLIFERKDL
jgi:Cu-processing system permease protein